MEKDIAEISGRLLEIAGIATIFIIGAYASLTSIFKIFKKHHFEDIIRSFRHQFGQGILLGLEFMVGADIIHTVAVDLNFVNLGILATIVLIRTFLSFTLELEITGRWPWQKEGKS